MKKIILLCFLLCKLVGFSQTVTAKPIYKGVQSLTIKELTGGAIYFGYQDDDYKTIVSIESFYVISKKEAIELMEKAKHILSMEKTDKDQDIIDNFKTIKLTRYGFNQKFVYIFNKDMKSLKLDVKEINKIIFALENYTYVTDSNK